MRILLINPDSDYWENKAPIPPSGLLYIASQLTEHGHEVDLLDLNIVKFKKCQTPLNAIEEKIRTNSTELIGIGCLFSGIFESANRYAQFIKEKFPTTKIVIGGMHPTMYHKEIIQHCPHIDYVVRGEGEISIVKLVKAIQGELDMENVPALSYRSGNEVRVNNQMEIIYNLDELPKLHFDLLQVKDYHYPEITKTWWNPRGISFDSTFPLLTSRGCPMHCNFCSMFLVTGRKWRYESPEKVVDKVEFLYNTYNQRHFSFMDDNITLNKTRIIGICEEIKRRNLNIEWETPNGISLKNLDDEIISAMCEAGMVRTTLAIEHANAYIRNKVMRKNVSTDQIYKAVEITRKYPELYVQAYFIVGMPEETEETMRETYEMIDAINIDYPRPTWAVPFPGTDLFDQCYRDNLITENVDVNNLWQTSHSLFKYGKKIFIKPYNLSLERLGELRNKIDELVVKKMKEKHEERMKTQSFVLPDYNPLG